MTTFTKPNQSVGTAKSQAAIALDAETFASDVLGSSGVALVDFWAEWCPPCRIVGPAVDQAACELTGRALVAKLDVDAAPGLASSLEISTIPTLVLFKDGEEIGRKSGILSTRDIVTWIERALSS